MQNFLYFTNTNGLRQGVRTLDVTSITEWVDPDTENKLVMIGIGVDEYNKPLYVKATDSFVEIQKQLRSFE